MQAEFDRHADSYEDEIARAIAFAGQQHGFYLERKAEHLVALVRKRLGDPAGLTALDVGCGSGLTDRLLAGRFAELHGVDASAEMVRRAARTNPTVAYEVGGEDRLPYEDARFDVTFAVNVVHHVEPPRRQAFVSELGRVTKPGGLVVVFEHNPLNPLTRRVVRNVAFDRGVELLGRSCARRLLVEAGLSPVADAFILFFPWRSTLLAQLERLLAPLPLGAQYFVAGIRGR